MAALAIKAERELDGDGVVADDSRQIAVRVDAKHLQIVVIPAKKRNSHFRALFCKCAK